MDIYIQSFLAGAAFVGGGLASLFIVATISAHASDSAETVKDRKIRDLEKKCFELSEKLREGK